jgi:hypothetical protein
MRRLALLFCLLFGTSTLIWAQADRGSITGTVADPTGAIITGVKVSVTQMETGVEYSGSVTNDIGVYRVLNLPIGKYALHFQHEGFKSYDRSGITISIAQNVTLGVTLNVGSKTETVTVTSDAALLDSEDATLGSSMNGKDLTELPLSISGGRDISNFAYSTVPTVSLANGTQTGATQTVAGSQGNSIITMIDGMDSNAGWQGTQPAPGMEAVQQFEVQTSGISAEAAQTGGGAFLFELKSGTNTIHGSAYGFLANEILDANTWDNKYFLSQCAAGDAACQSQYRRAKNRFSDYGFSGGGPAWKNHTFFFVDYEKYNQSDWRYLQNQATVPTTAMLGGDFSQLLVNPATGQPNPRVLDQNGNLVFDGSGNPVYAGAIFNPANPGNVFPDNIIPGGAISTKSKELIAIYQKYYKPTNSNVANNYPSLLNYNPLQQKTNWDLKLDHNFSAKHHASGSISSESLPQTSQGDSGLWSTGTQGGGPFVRGQLATINPYTLRLADDYTITPNLMNSFSAGYNFFAKVDATTNKVSDQQLGFPTTGNATQNFPSMDFGSGNNLGETSVGSRFADYFNYYQYHYKDTMQWVKGRHNIKFGGEYIAYGANSHSNPAGVLYYFFSGALGEPWQIYYDSVAGAKVGFGFANMLLGYSNSANITQPIIQYGRRKSGNLLVADRLKVNNKLTLDASIRWDLNGRWHNANGQWSNFDPNATNTSWAPYLGAFDFIKDSSQSFETNEDYHLFTPHIGASYMLTQKIVLRGSYGYYHVPLGINQWGGLPYSSRQAFGYTGVNQVVPPNPYTQAFNWDVNTYPGVYTPPDRAPNTNIGCPGCMVNVDPNELYLGHTNNWNVGAEYAFTKNTVVDVNYIGTEGGHLHDGSLDPRVSPTWSNYKPLLMSGHANDWIQNQAQATAAGVPWLPFLTTMTNGWGGYSASDAIQPFPQAIQGVLFTGFPGGQSRYDALVAEVKKRAGSGLAADMSYTFSHETGNVNRKVGNAAEGWGSSPYQDPYSYASQTGTISPNDVRHQMKGYLTYELPLGQNKRWLSGSHLLNYGVGGWTLGTNVNYHGGLPMPAIHPSFWNYPGWGETFAHFNNTPGGLRNHFKKLDLNNLSDSSNQFFDPNDFIDPTNANGLYGTLGNQPTLFSNWRGWGWADESLSVVKKFAFGRDNRFHAELRTEFFDVLNRHYWFGPNASNVGQSNFGNVTGVTGNRTGQFGGRFEW